MPFLAQCQSEGGRRFETWCNHLFSTVDRPPGAFPRVRTSSVPRGSPKALSRETRAGSCSIVQDEIYQQFCPYHEFSVVLDQAHFSEFVHEVRDAGPRGAYHFGQSLVTQHGNTCILDHVMLPQPRKLQENPCEAFLTMVEKLVAKIFFQVDVTSQQ